jgi:hypothetical protein
MQHKTQKLNLLLKYYLKSVDHFIYSFIHFVMKYLFMILNNTFVCKKFKINFHS